MRIKFLTRLKDTLEGLPTSFEKGDVRTVSERDGGRFVGHGWAVEEGSEEKPSVLKTESVDIVIHDSALGSTDNLGAP